MNGNELIEKLLKEFGGISQHDLAALLGKKNSQLSAIRKQKSVSALSIARMMASLNKQIVRGDTLLPKIQKKLGLQSNSLLADTLGMTGVALASWERQQKGITATQIVNSIAACKRSAVKRTHKTLIRPIIEFFPLDAVVSTGGTHYELFATKSGASSHNKSIRALLQNAKGIYIFYDSQGKAVYAGKAQSRPLWAELKSVFNRNRKTQAVYRVRHPTRNQDFKPAYVKPRQPRKSQVILSDIATYISVYEVDQPMIGSLESLLVRGFANDLLNVRMEKFANTKPRKKTTKTISKKTGKKAVKKATKKTTKRARKIQKKSV